MHGYDVCDPLQLNPELGSAEDFAELMSEVKARGMGWIQDIVPNHMAVSGANRMLVDVLENGPSSRFFSFFDIEWEHPYENMHGRMLAPFLGGLYNETLERGEIRIGFDEDGFYVRYYELRFPLRLDSYSRILTEGLDALRRKLGRDHIDYVKLLGILYSIKALPDEAQEERYNQIFFIKRMLFELYESSADIRAFLNANLDRFNGGEHADSQDPWGLLDSLLSEQYFRLSFWKVAGDEINYRRFFSINDLISLRVEDDAVFDYTHRLILEKIRSGEFNGLRVDHVDGLYDPTGYLRRLRDCCGEAYLVVEKILSGNEPLPAFWPVQGTTGYEFLNCVCGLFVDKSNGPAFDQIYTSFTSIRRPLGKLLAQKKTPDRGAEHGRGRGQHGPAGKDHFRQGPPRQRYYAQGIARGHHRTAGAVPGLPYVYFQQYAPQSGLGLYPGHHPYRTQAQARVEAGAGFSGAFSAAGIRRRNQRGRPPQMGSVRDALPAGHRSASGQGAGGYCFLRHEPFTVPQRGGWLARRFRR